MNQVTMNLSPNYHLQLVYIVLLYLIIILLFLLLVVDVHRPYLFPVFPEF